MTFRPAASGVSALWGFVANGRRAVHPVSSSPSKIPYGGFSPVRLQTGFRPRPSPPAHTRRGLIRGHESASPHPSLAPTRGNRRSESALRVRAGGRSGPEALGSPAGCAVPPGRRLLWPHPRVWPAPDALCSSAAGLCHPAAVQRFPNLLRVSFAPCRLPYPGGSGGRDCCSSTRGGLRPSVRGSAPASPTQNSVHAWLRNEAAEFALCCGPELRSPFTDKDFYIGAFAS